MASTADQGTPIAALRPQGFARLAILREYAQASRPRIVGMVLFTMTVSALVATPQVPAWGVLANALVGAGLVIVGAIALNQRLERASDAKMPRTARRPLPAGRLTARQVTVFGAVTSLAGIAYLAVLVNGAIVMLAALSWVVYVWVYTPSKLRTRWQTAIGAVAGAMPALLGSAAVGATTSPVALGLFGAVFFWQFPHAMAIAWLYRHEFAAAEVKLPTVIDPTGRTAGIMAVLGAAALLPTSLVPSFSGGAGLIYAALATLLGLAYAASSVKFLLHRDDRSARGLLRTSVIYLPLLLVALLAAMRC